MRNKKILVLIIIALIVVLFASILIIKLKQTNKIDIVSEKEIVNEINNTEEEITEENIVVESKIEEQKTQEENLYKIRTVLLCKRIFSNYRSTAETADWKTGQVDW